MNSTEPPQPSSPETVTFTIRRSSRNVFFAKILILLGLILVSGQFYAHDNAKKYQKGRELTKEKHLADFEERRSSLLNFKQYESPIVATFIMLIYISILIGGYELLALVIGLMIGKVIRR
jgi:hypothetical protein